MTALARLGLRLAWGGGARERVRSLSVAAAAAAGVWVLLMTVAVLDAVLDSLGRAYGGQELAVFSAGVWISVGVPVVVLVATAGRLSASVRDRRLASLRLMGLPPSSTRIVAAVEVGLATLVGALVGGVAFWLMRALVPSVRLDELVVRPAQTSWVAVLGVLVAVLVVSVAVAVAPTRRRAGQALASVRAADVRGVPWWRLAPVGFGVVLLVATRTTDVRDAGDPSGLQIGMLFAGAGLAGIGMLVLLPATVRLIAGALVHVPHATVRLAGRRMQAQPAGVQRVVAGLLAALFVITGARMVLVAFEDADRSYAAARTALDGGPQKIHVDVPRDVDGVVAATLRAHPLVDRVAADRYVSTPCRAARSLCLSAFIGTCAELVEALPGVTGCREGEAAFVGEAPAGTRAPGPTLTWRADGSRSLTTPTPARTLAHDWSEGDLVYANVYLPKSTPGVADLLGGSRPSWLVSATGGETAAAQLRAALREVTPQVSVIPEWRAADTAYIDTMRRGLWLLATLVVSIGLLSFVLGGIDRALSRRSESARLQVFGTPRRTIRNAQWIEALLPLLVGVPLAAGLGSFAGATFLYLGSGDEVATPYTGVVAVVGATMIGSVLVAGLTVVAAAPRLRAELIRAE